MVEYKIVDINIPQFGMSGLSYRSDSSYILNCLNIKFGERRIVKKRKMEDINVIGINIKIFYK
jgi:hypothetical protein